MFRSNIDSCEKTGKTKLDEFIQPAIEIKLMLFDLTSCEPI